MAQPATWNSTLPINCRKRVLLLVTKMGPLTNVVAMLHSFACNVATSSVTGPILLHQCAPPARTLKYEVQGPPEIGFTKAPAELPLFSFYLPWKKPPRRRCCPMPIHGAQREGHSLCPRVQRGGRHLGYNGIVISAAHGEL